jgi:hypothetical protein
MNANRGEPVLQATSGSEELQQPGSASAWLKRHAAKSDVHNFCLLSRCRERTSAGQSYDRLSRIVLEEA